MGGRLPDRRKVLDAAADHPRRHPYTTRGTPDQRRPHPSYVVHMTKQLTALLAAATLAILALAGPAAAADPVPQEETEEEVTEESLGESPTSGEAETKDEKKEEDTDEEETSWSPSFGVKIGDGSVRPYVSVFGYTVGGFYDPEGDIPRDEPGQDQGGKEDSRPGTPGPIVLASR